MRRKVAQHSAIDEAAFRSLKPRPLRPPQGRAVCEKWERPRYIHAEIIAYLFARTRGHFYSVRLPQIIAGVAVPVTSFLPFVSGYAPASEAQPGPRETRGLWPKPFIFNQFLALSLRF